MDSLKPVRRCVCMEMTFESLKKAKISSVEEAARRYGCGTKCGNCRPYIERMLVTGETEFPVLHDLSRRLV